MYLIKKITISDKNFYLTSKIINHTNKTISAALILLENAALENVREENGRNAYEQTKIIDIHSLEQINEPLLDSILLYRLSGDPHRILVYQKKTSIIKSNNWTWGTSDIPISQFRLINYFELEEYNGKFDTNIENNIPTPPIEMVQFGKIKIPKQMTIAPMCHLINELKGSERFKARFTYINSI